MATKKKEAVLWEPLDNNAVQCRLCNFRCRIAKGGLGHCQVRRNDEGSLYSINYHAICSAAADPIEKKPLFHFQPGSRSFSIAAPGCNFRCEFCQNWQISQYPLTHDSLPGQSFTPKQIIDAAREHRCSSIAYTYTEPTIFMELAADCGRYAREQGLANVFVSNGYMTIDAVEYACDFLDAINVDLKSFSADFYRNICHARLEPVLETLRHIARNTDIWLEITTLIVPGSNDGETELKQIAEFIANECGPHVPWHISRFHPDYQYDGVGPTPAEMLEMAYNFGKAAGLRYVYIGNLPGSGHENTTCPDCGRTLIERPDFRLSVNHIINGICPDCGAKIDGVGLDGAV